jgi:SSS family solute:Na+ symporter
MKYIQTLFSIFNAPLFATFIIAMFWRRATAWGGFWSLVAGTVAAYGVNCLNASVMPEPPETRGTGSGRIRRAPAT